MASNTSLLASGSDLFIVAGMLKTPGLKINQIGWTRSWLEKLLGNLRRTPLGRPLSDTSSGCQIATTWLLKLIRIRLPMGRESGL